jgi:hypothetical protein
MSSRMEQKVQAKGSERIKKACLGPAPQIYRTGYRRGPVAGKSISFGGFVP